MMLRAFLVFMFVAVGHGQSSSQAPQEFAGCYEVTFLKWSPPDHSVTLIPKQFELLNESCGGTSCFRMHSRGTEEAQRHYENLWSWNPKGNSRVKLSLSTGLGGYRGTLKRAGNSDLAGKIKEWCDSRCGWKKRTGTLRIHRIVCRPS
jgi:hypothetical protein